MEPTPNSRAPRRSRVVRKLGIALGVLLALLLAAYFVVTSGAFLKSVVLPKVGAAMNSQVTAGDIALSPFSQLVLRDFKVQPDGAPTLLTVREIRIRYSLFTILGGTMAVEELFVDTPVVTVIQNADGTSNLTPILKAGGKPGTNPTPATSTTASKPLVLDLRHLVVTNASFSQTIKSADGSEQVTQVTDASLALNNLKNGQTATLAANANLAIRVPKAAGTSLAAKFGSQLNLAIGNDGLPQSANGGARLEVTQASGTLAEFAQSAMVLDCAITPTEFKQLSLKLQRAGASLGEVRVAGPFDATKREGRLALEAFGIDRTALNLATRSLGLDFIQTSFSSTNRIELADGGKRITLTGDLFGRRLSVTRDGLTSPVLDVRAGYDLTMGEQDLVLRALSVQALRGENRLLDGALTKAMKFDLTKGAAGADESQFKLTLTGLDLRDYRAFLGTNVLTGLINGVLDVQAASAGKQILLTLNADGSGLSAVAGGTSVQEVGFNLKSSATLLDFVKLQLKQADFHLSHKGAEAARVQVSGTADLDKQNVTLALNANASLPALTALVPAPGTTLNAGTLAFDGSVKQENITLPGTKQLSFAQSLNGNLTVSGLNGAYGDYRFDQWGAKTAFDLAGREGQWTVRKLNGTLTQAGQPAGDFDVTADYRGASGTSKIALLVNNLNERALAPFLNASLGGGTLKSIAVNAKLEGSYDPATDSALRGTATVTNLVVTGLGFAANAAPLQAALDLDVALRKQTAEIRTCLLKLTPTARARNELSLMGKVDFANTNALTGALKLGADTLDFTPYYDLFMGATGAVAKASAPVAGASAPVVATPAPSAAETEPPAMDFGLRNFTFDAAVNRCFLRDLDLAAFKTTVKLDGGRVLVKPFEAKLNGAPVNAVVDLDLGIPGYKYDVQFSAPGVPVAPLVSLALPSRAGQFGGTATAEAALRGAGITGPSLQKNLAGTTLLSATNLNFKLSDAHSSLVKTLINTVIGIPDLLRNPTTAISGLLGRLTGGSGSSGGGGSSPGWVDQIMNAPVQVVLLRAKAGGGQVELQEGLAQSAAFIGKAKGDITLAPVLTNSTLQIPLEIFLARGLAERVHLLPANTPTNAAFARLPDFVTLKGTLGAPRADLDKVAVIAMAAQAGAGLLGTNNTTAGRAGGLLGTVGNLLGGNPPPVTTTNGPATTNAPAASPVQDLMNLFGKPKKKQ